MVRSSWSQTRASIPTFPQASCKTPWKGYAAFFLFELSDFVFSLVSKYLICSIGFPPDLKIIGLEEVEYSVSLDSNGVMIIIDSNNNSVNASVEEKLAPFMKSTTTTGAASLTTTAAASQKTTIATSQTTTTVVPTTKITTCDDETQKLSTPKQPSLSSRDSAENVPFDPTTPTKDGGKR